ncbi:MAG: type VI secretion system contractile sheath small subunit [Thermoanaerobaculia bacterium]
MAKEGSVAPRERVNIVYKPATGDVQEDVELPLKLLMLGDYTGRADDRPLEEREPIEIDKDNFNKVMGEVINRGLKSSEPSLTIQVANRLADKEGEEMPVSLKVNTLKDFEPESVARQVPALRELLELRLALTALKGPLGNLPEFRKKIQSSIKDAGARERVLKELGAKAQQSAGEKK